MYETSHGSAFTRLLCRVRYLNNPDLKHTYIERKINTSHVTEFVLIWTSRRSHSLRSKGEKCWNQGEMLNPSLLLPESPNTNRK